MMIRRKGEKMEKKICPKCKSINIVEIVYSYPPYGLYRKELRGEIKLGGCEVRQKEWFYKDCSHEF